jgi:hypothetical protein
MDDQTGTSPDEQPSSGKSDDDIAERDEAGDKPESKAKEEGKPDGKKDDEQAQKDQFATVAGDPLADVPGTPSARAGQGQAYRSWMQTVQASGAAAFVGGGTIGVLNIAAPSGAYERRGQAPGPVRSEVFTELINKYAPVPGYERLMDQLSTARLLVLKGAPGTGRTTTGLRLLAKLTDTVARFSPDTDIRALTAADFEPHSGYLQELTPSSRVTPPTADQVDLLRDYLTERECYLVLITPHDIRYRDSFDGCILDCPLPEPREVFRQAVEYETVRWPDKEQLPREIAADDQLYSATGPQTPAEVQWLVAHLLSAGVAKHSAADLDLLFSDLAARYVSAWFEPLARLPVTAEGDEPVRLSAFRVALAVLNNCPVNVVAEAAEELAGLILKARSPRRMPDRPVFALHREDYVANSRASVKPGSVKYIDATIAVSIAAYDDDRLPLAILRQAWAAHNLREPLLSWLETLSDDPRPLVHVRAALTIGLLTSWDFTYTFHARLQPWATSREAGRRWNAAVALNEASRSDEVRPAVRALLEDWCEHGKFTQRWTAAVTLRYYLGLEDPEKALKELRKLGCWKDGKLAQVATLAAAGIFVLGGVKPVMDKLGDWLDDERRDVRYLGLNTVQILAYMKVSDAEDFELTATSTGLWTRLANRSRWPLLVALADEDPPLLESLADLVWQLTRSARAQAASATSLKRWMRAGKKAPSCIGPVGRFLALLGDDDSDRARLLHLVRLLRRDRDDPLPAPIADRLELAIERNIHIIDKKKLALISPQPDQFSQQELTERRRS